MRDTSNEYLGLIFTNHALERMRGRGLKKDWVWETWKHPEDATQGSDGATRYSKRFDTYTVTVVVKQTERREWLVISAWIDPPMPGSIDVGKKEKYHKYQKASFMGKLWLTLKEQIGL